MSAYGQLLLDKVKPNFVPPHKNLDGLTCPIEHLAENLRAIRDHLDRAGLSSSRDTITSMTAINTVVHHTSVIMMKLAKLFKHNLLRSWTPPVMKKPKLRQLASLAAQTTKHSF